ncbi:Retrovirus-related Pol polyprotein from transposon 17.6, partial [Mucuna pruriens]
MWSRRKLQNYLSPESSILSRTASGLAQCRVLPKKFRMTVMTNQHDELCFLDGFSGYMQIHIVPKDQHKTTFTCPFGTFVYTRMLFGLCNAPSTFQHCMTSIFSDLLQDCMEVFMEDFTVLTRCIDTNLVLNFEKCHFMVIEGIVLGHLVDKSKIDIITFLSNPASVREVRLFLGHAGFYGRFIKNFSKIALPLFKLLQKDMDFKFDQPCIEAFQEMKNRLTSTPIL